MYTDRQTGQQAGKHKDGWTEASDPYVSGVFKCNPLDITAVAGSGKVGPVNQVNHTSWVAVFTPTDRPKSVRNRCLIELFCGIFLCCHFALLTFPLV